VILRNLISECHLDEFYSQEYCVYIPNDPSWILYTEAGCWWGSLKDKNKFEKMDRADYNISMEFKQITMEAV
jgi:hypothetical protein